MFEHVITVPLNHNFQESKKFVIEKLSSDPTTEELKEARIWYNKTEKVLKIFNGSGIAEVGLGGSASSFGSLVSDFNASSGLLPTSGNGEGGAILKGDYWRISTAGTISGLTPLADLEIGDILVSKIDSPTNVGDYFALQGNLNPATSDKNHEFGFTDVSTINVNHNLGKRPSVTIIDTNGDEIEADVEHIDNNNLVITMNITLSGTVVCN